MTSLDIAQQRLHNQRIAGAPSAKPADVVRWLGAVQAQDYPAAKWTLGLRSQRARDADVEQAFTEGALLRTHVMRPTWHFVLPEDIRWLLALTAPRVKANLAHYDRKLELDGALLARSNAAMQQALEGGKQLTRAELAAILQQAGIDAQGTQRLAHIIVHAELDGVVCSGARRGKQFTYALLDERAPKTRTLQRDEALAELTGRYFASHGPATLKDYTWWSGLTTADAKAGIEMVKPQLVQQVVDGQTYWLAEPTPFVRDPSPTAYLLPNFDEYAVAYADRSAIFDASHLENLDPQANIYFGPMGRRNIASIELGNSILIDGKIAGTWKRTFNKEAVVIETHPFTKLSDAESEAVTTAARRYGAFLGMPVIL